MSQIPNLWPENIGTTNIVMPKRILEQQADFLSMMTKNRIVANVETSQGRMQKNDENVMIHEFNVNAPSMGNYQFTLLRVIHNFNIYPLRVYDALAEESTEVDTEPQLLETLAVIFASRKTQNAINAIIAQSS
jgi:hypothetical protein